MNLSLNGDPWSKLLVDDTDVLDSDTARALCILIDRR